jgi:hypothetical protein
MKVLQNSLSFYQKSICLFDNQNVEELRRQRSFQIHFEHRRADPPKFYLQ